MSLTINHEGYQQLDLLPSVGTAAPPPRSPGAFQVGDRVWLLQEGKKKQGRVLGVRSPRGLEGCVSVQVGDRARWLPAELLLANPEPPSAPEQLQPCPWVSSGWIELYTVTRSRKKFRYSRYCWRGLDGRKRHKHVPSEKLAGVEWMIRQGHTPDKVVDFLRRPLR